MLKTFKLSIVLVLIAHSPLSQEIKWFGESPEMMNALEGRGWDDIGFNRLPDSAENVVRTPVWDLSRQTAGMMLRFS